MESVPPHHISLRSFLILSSHLRLGLLSCFFVPSGVSTKTMYAFLFSPVLTTCPAHLDKAETLRPARNLTVNNKHVHTSPQLNCIPNHIYRVHMPTPWSFNVHFNIISFTRIFPKWSLSYKFSYKNCIHFPRLSCLCVLRHAHTILLNLMKLILFVSYLTKLSASKLQKVTWQEDYNERGAVADMRNGKGTQNSWRKSSPVPLFPSEAPHGLILDQTRIVTLRNQALTAWARTLPHSSDVSWKRQMMNLPHYVNFSNLPLLLPNFQTFSKPPCCQIRSIYSHSGCDTIS
jgi:hypothetical protein